MEKNTSSASPAETPWRSFLRAFPASQSNSMIFDKPIKAVYYCNIHGAQTARDEVAGNSTPNPHLIRPRTSKLDAEDKN